MRNYNVEKTAGRGNLALRMVEVKEARHEASTMELMLIAQIMVFCGLPYRRSADRRIVRKARTGKGSTVTVTFQAMVDGVDIPFGSDRTLLHWVTHHAVIERQSVSPGYGDVDLRTEYPTRQGSLSKDCLGGHCCPAR